MENMMELRTPFNSPNAKWFKVTVNSRIDLTSHH